jgi:hypothetical protein
VNRHILTYMILIGVVLGAALLAAAALDRRPRPHPRAPADPAAGVIWDVLHEAREITRAAAAGEAAM